MAFAFYVVQLCSWLVWCVGALQLVRQQKKVPHAEWHSTAAWLFVGYCFFELPRIVDVVYTDFETGVPYSVWGILPWWTRIYAWVLRDVLMFRGIVVYVEHALVWSHTCMEWPLPHSVLLLQKACCFFGNVIFFVGATLYMGQNNQFWQPVCALGQVPPNVAVGVATFYLSRCFPKVPDCEEKRHAMLVNSALLFAAVTCVCVFVPWAITLLMNPLKMGLQVHPGASAGSPIFHLPPPPFLSGFLDGTIVDQKLDLMVEIVEVSVGWCGLIGLRIISSSRSGSSEPLVRTSKEIGLLVAEVSEKTATKKSS